MPKPLSFVMPTAKLLAIYTLNAQRVSMNRLFVMTVSWPQLILTASKYSPEAPGPKMLPVMVAPLRPSSK